MQTLPDRIYFTGFMAAGKTTVGRLVANTLGYNFVDLDRMVETTAGCTVQELFRVQGESAFRDLEHQALRSSAELSETVIALGGGALSTPGSWQLIESNSLVVYLRVASSALARRIQFGKSVRPLMLDDTGAVLPYRALHERVESLLKEREADYERADIIYDSGRRSVGVTVDLIVNLIRKFDRMN